MNRFILNVVVLCSLAALLAGCSKQPPKPEPHPLECAVSIANTIEPYQFKAEALGVTLLNCGIKDVILPGEVKDIMNQVLIAEKKAQANTIMRREETASTRSLLNTARLMEDNQMLFKLKEMEYVEKIAEKINNISLSGGSLVVDQLKQIFVPEKK